MKKETRENLQVGSALGMLVLGSIFGVAIYAHNKYAEIKTYVEKRMSASQN